MNEEELKYWPCTLVEHDDHCSIIFSRFHYFDDYFEGADCGGYTIQRLAKRLTKEHGIKGLKYDSEASMFCAYSENKELLESLCVLFKNILGDPAEYLPPEGYPKKEISDDEADSLLVKGFVIADNKGIQEEFYKKVPAPWYSKRIERFIKWVKEGTAEEKITAAKKINNEARTLTRKRDHYLSHPAIIDVFLKAIDNCENKKVYAELICALVFICDRHMPDLRCKPYFIKALSDKIALNRQRGIWGLGNLYYLDSPEVKEMLNDKSQKVVKDAELRLKWAEKRDGKREIPSWMFHAKYFE